MLTLEKTHLILAQNHSKSDKISELLILLFTKGSRVAPAKKAYL